MGLGVAISPALGQENAFLERLDRGFVGAKTENGVFLSWRLLGTDDEKISFDLYRDGNKVNKNGALKSVTNFTDPDGDSKSKYVLRALDSGGRIIETCSLDSVMSSPALRIALDVPPKGITPDCEEYLYTPSDCSVGDVDGDGQYEIILKWAPSNEHDNSHSGYTGNVLLDCYKLNGKKLWRIDLGRNIRAGAHYTQFLVLDFDNDGKAEMACKTAPGSIDGKGVFVSEASSDASIRNTDNGATYVNDFGHVIAGPEYLTVFSGETGEALSTVYYMPSRDICVMGKRSVDGKPAWGDEYGNRSERYLATVAFLPDGDGHVKPSMVFCRGYYTFAHLAAWQFDGKELTNRWFYHDTVPNDPNGLYGQGAHSIIAADVDADGFDEITYGAAALDHDGTVLYNTGWGHGDALHLSDMDPDRPGLEVFMPHEEPNHRGATPDDPLVDYGAELRDARTGEILFCVASDEDNGRGVAADIDSTSRGYELWSLESRNVYDVRGNIINATTYDRPPVNFRVYWDGDLLDELFDGGRQFRHPDLANLKRPNSKPRRNRRRPGQIHTPPAANPNEPAGIFSRVFKWNSQTKRTEVLQVLGASTCNGSKNTPNFSGDILGDWREEIILHDGANLIIYMTTIPSDYRVVTLPHNHAYRMGMAFQNVCYNQPPHLGFYLRGLFDKK